MRHPKPSLSCLAPLAVVFTGLAPCVALGADPVEDCKRVVEDLEKAQPGDDVSSKEQQLEACLAREDFKDALQADQALSDRVDALEARLQPAPVKTDDALALAKERVAKGVDGTPFEREPGRNDYARKLEKPGRVEKAVGTGASVPDEVVELFTILADVAVKRAKRSGLAYLHDRLESTACDLRFGTDQATKVVTWTLGGTGERILPATCTLLQNTSLERIVSQPETLATAVVEDLLGTLSIEIVKQLAECTDKSTVCTPEANAKVRELVELGVRVAARSLAAKQFTIQLSDAEVFIDILLDDHVNVRTHWKDRVIATALGGLAVALSEVKSGNPVTAVSISRIVHAIQPDGMTVDETMKAIDLVSLGLKAATATDSSGKADVDTRIKASIQLVFALAYRVIDSGGAETSGRTGRAGLEQLERLLLAVLDRDVAAAIAAGAGYLQLVVDDLSHACKDDECQAGAREKKYDLQHLSILLASVASYSATYAKGGTEATPEQLREARTAAVEAAVDAFTDRHRRYGDWVGSIALPVGFSVTGLQLVRTRTQPTASATYSLEYMKPQLSLPLGLAIQRLPGRRYRKGKVSEERSFRWDGFHAQATAIDLGQFVAYDADGDVTKPKWNTFMSFGGQLGWLIGSPSNAFVIAADVRYAPALFPADPSDPAQAQRVGGALRAGIFVAYYVSLFDFN